MTGHDMIIALEGPDGAGKTTLVREIRRQATALGMHVATVHMSAPVFDPSSTHSRAEQAWLEHDSLLKIFTDADPIGHMFIVDRFHWGTFAYGNVFRQEHSLNGWGDMGEDLFVDIEWRLDGLGAVTALITNNTPTLVDRIAARGDDYLDTSDKAKLAEKISAVKAQYDELLGKGHDVIRTAHFTDFALNDTLDTEIAARELIDTAENRAFRRTM